MNRNGRELYDAYRGTALVAGSAPCLFADLRSVFKRRDAAGVFALNGAAAEIAADFLVSLHARDLEYFRRHSINRNIITMTRHVSFEKNVVADYLFDDCNSGATSAGCAVKIAIQLGFDEIILCGCPLNGGDGYTRLTEKIAVLPEKQRLERMRAGHPTHDVHINNLRHESRSYPDNVTVRSMSGRSAEVLGRPDFFAEAAA